MNSEGEKNNFVPLMDMITSSNDINLNSQEKLNSYDTSYQINTETVDEEDESKEKLNSDYNKNLLDVNNSGIIQIPQKFLDEQNQSYNSDSLIENTLDESILKTIARDLKLIYYKIKYVLNPFSSPSAKKFHINNWDLWGPLIFITFLSCTINKC